MVSVVMCLSSRWSCGLSSSVFVLQAVLRRRDAIQVEYEMTLEELNRKKDEKEQVGGGRIGPNPVTSIST